MIGFISKLINSFNIFFYYYVKPLLFDSGLGWASAFGFGWAAFGFDSGFSNFGAL